MSDIDIVIRDAIRSFESIEFLNKEIEGALNYDLCADSINDMNAMICAIHSVAQCQIKSLKTALGDK